MNDSDILKYLKDQYIETKWPFVRFTDLSNLFGIQYTKKELNLLYELKMINKRDCAQGILVELIIEPEIISDNELSKIF